jgi:nucleoside-diphosphate kinase
MERTLVIVKPDGVRRKLVGEVIRRFEARGLKILGLRFEQADEDTVKKHYAEHIDKPFYGSLVEYLTSGPIVIMALEGPNAIKAVRATMGATNPAESAPGTIRGDFALSIEENIVHGSADQESAEKELQLWFSEGLKV